MARRKPGKPTIVGHAITATKTVAQAEAFAAELKLALDDGTIAPDDAEAMLADLAAAGGAAAALAAYVEGVIGRQSRKRASARKKRKSARERASRH